MPKRRQTKAEKIAQIPIEEIMKLSSSDNKETLDSYLKTLSMGYKRRVASFKRKGIFSYAQDRYEAYHPKLGPKDIAKMSYNRKILEIAKLQHFFNSETSNEEGIRRVNREQDIRIFGADKKGRPRAQMDEETRKAYWRLYDQFILENPTRFPQSNPVQQMLGSIDLDDELVEALNDPDLESEDLPESFRKTLETLEQMLSNSDNFNTGGPNAYMGRGPTID